MNLAKPVTAEDLTFTIDSDDDEKEVRVIVVTAGSLVTAENHERLSVTDGRLEADIDRDILLLAMVDRLGKGTGIGLGFVTGFKLRNGAFASTANAVCENIVIVGTNPADMAVAANHLAAIGGGKVAVERRGGRGLRRSASARPPRRGAAGESDPQLRGALCRDRTNGV